MGNTCSSPPPPAPPAPRPLPLILPTALRSDAEPPPRAPAVFKASEIWGSSAGYAPRPAALVAEANFYDYAPAPCSDPCVAYNCLVADPQRARQYAHVYENRLELNHPVAPCCCFTTEACLIDRIFVFPMDKFPFRSPPICCGVPCGLLGPPVLFVHKPACGCLDVTQYFGDTLKAAPCACFNLKLCLCCGNPCYVLCSFPLLSGLKDGGVFLSAAKQAHERYLLSRTEIPEAQQAQYAEVEDNLFDFGRVRPVSYGSSRVEARQAAAEGQGVRSASAEAADAPSTKTMMRKADSRRGGERKSSIRYDAQTVPNRR